jgi:hypothetical protein
MCPIWPASSARADRRDWGRNVGRRYPSMWQVRLSGLTARPRCKRLDGALVGPPAWVGRTVLWPGAGNGFSLRF